MAPPSPSFSASTVEAPGALLHVRMAGTGPEIVLLPSLGRGSEDFARLAADLVAASFRVILPEPRGIPPSLAIQEPATLHDLARDVAYVIRELCAPPVAVLGHAFGNRVARTLATAQPELVRELLLLACGGIVPIAPAVLESLSASFALALPEEERLAHVARAFFAEPARAVLWRDGWYPDVAAFQGAATHATPIESWWLGGEKDVLILQPACDAIAPVENARRLAEPLGERARVVEIADAGHAALPEQPDAIARAVIAFLRRPR